MTTLEMMILAKETGKTYCIGDFYYSHKTGFTESNGTRWIGAAFNYLNDVLDLKEWQESNNNFMTRKEAEEKFNITIID